MRTRLHSVFGAVLLGILSLGAVSCEQEPVIPDPEFVLVRDVVSSRKGSQFLEVYAQGNWTITCDADWIRITPDKGRGNSRAVALLYDANTEEGPRQADIRLQAQEKTLTVTLRQNAPSDDPEPEINGGSSTRKGWMELPETRPDDGLNIFWHNMTVGSYTGRNYSFYWDYSKLVSHWVAYPLNNGLKGSGSRSNAWGVLDPCLPDNEQPNTYYTYGGGWTRGHQIPSADRLKTAKANESTFYPTNMTPQDYDFNSGIWAALEGAVRGYASKSDTLYVVTGCDISTNIGMSGNNTGFRVKAPGAYWKAVVSYQKSRSVYGGFLGCAFYLPHDTTISDGSYIDYILSIDDLEKKIGIDLFVNLPGKIGEDNASKLEALAPGSFWK